MPLYEYRCLDCDERFEERRAVADADGASCPQGHVRVKRLLSTFATVGASSDRAGAAPAMGGGGCCGGACGCR